MVPEAPEAAWLEVPLVEAASYPRHVHPLDPAIVTTIGSAKDSGIVVAARGVSRRHAGIRWRDGRYELADFGSTAGVFVNGRRITKTDLHDGDRIQLGPLEALFRCAKGASDEVQQSEVQQSEV